MAEQFYKDLPKVELHAHLNGSISSTTTEKLITKKPHLSDQHNMTVISRGQKRTLEECFEMFKIIHQLTVSDEDVFVVTKDVVKEFAADGVKYIELRSTPREEKSTGMTKKSYVSSVLEAIKQCKNEGVDIDVRFLLAIDRRNGPTIAMETVKLAEEFFRSSDGVVVGLDLSGNPAVGDGKNFIAPLQAGRNLGLKLALHLAEIPNQNEESEMLLSIPPDRIGHGTFLHPEVGGSQRLVDTVKKYRIPLELCFSSNVKSQTISSYDQHHFHYWYNLGHPCVVCTDDKGVFGTDLSLEYQITASTFNLSKTQIWDLSYQSINCIFAPESVKSDLKRRWNELKPGLFTQD
uniref:N6-Methyl-AMP deaminase n=1 Tax=Callorhinchus milii TaxID=7868 RepID=A0A4W3JWI8_CALMI|eukprot:gi/632956324/ref/XP_007893901.1/ PREDICTED: adenosine deaminase-like protein isoform X1 [Callorhinchus milii]